jgi:NADH dehydrogenase
VLLEAGPLVLPTFGQRLSRRTARTLTGLGVEVLTETMLVDVDADGVEVRGPGGETRRIEARTKVWAAGVSVSPLAGLLATATGTARTRAGQLQVLPDCTLAGHPEVFVVGDMMSAGVPSVAQVAIQSGRFAARLIAARLDGTPREASFRYRDKGTLATISKFQAVGRVGPLELWGLPAWLLWLFVHLVALVGFKSRTLVVVHWLISFTGNGRAERTAPHSSPRRR